MNTSTYVPGITTTDENGKIQIRVDYGGTTSPVVRIGRLDDKTGRANEYGLWATNADSPQTHFVLSTVEDQPQIKPCPFCGSKRITMSESTVPIGIVIKVRCSRCGTTASPRLCCPEMDPELAERQAYAYWNRRQAPQE